MDEIDRYGAWCDGDAVPVAWDGRAGGLEAWAERADAEHERAAHDVTDRVVRLDGCVRMLRGMARRAGSLPWAAVLMSLGLVAWVTARRLAGAEVDEDDIAAAFRSSRRAPFGGARSVLAAARSTAVIGVGPVNYQLAEDTDFARASRARGSVGYDFAYSNPTRVGGAVPKGLSAVERRVDAVWALRASGLSPDDLAIVEAVEVGESKGRARRTKAGIEEAIQRVDITALALRLGVSEREARGRVRRASRLLGLALEERSVRCKDAQGQPIEDRLVMPQRRARRGARDEAREPVGEIAGVALPRLP
jgi:hypothetical protein